MKKSSLKTVALVGNILALVAIIAAMAVVAIAEKDIPETAAWFVASLWCFVSLLDNIQK